MALLYTTKFKIDQVIHWNLYNGQSLVDCLFEYAWHEYAERKPDEAAAHVDSWTGETHVNSLDGTITIEIHSNDPLAPDYDLLAMMETATQYADSVDAAF